MNKTLKDLEDEILRLLSAEGDILDNKELMQTSAGVGGGAAWHSRRASHFPAQRAQTQDNAAHGSEKKDGGHVAHEVT